MTIDFQEVLPDMEQQIKADLEILLWEMEILINKIREINGFSNTARSGVNGEDEMFG